MKFLGIDLGWTSGASGLCCLVWQDEELQLLDLNRRESVADILSWIDTWISSKESGMIAVDAQILTGMRPVDRLAHRLVSLLCAYVAAHWWYWGLERNWVLGIADFPASGYIVVPKPF